MPKPIINGKQGAIRQRTREQFDPQNGKTWVTEYESAGRDCASLAISFERAGIAYDLVDSEVRSTLTTTQPANPYGNQEEQAVERWELLSNQNQLDIREHPNSVALGQTLLARVLKDVKAHESGKTVVTNTSPYTDGARALFRLLIRGVTHYQVPQWVLRYTANVSDTYNFFTTVNSGVGQIFTMSQVISSVSSPRIQSALGSISSPPADTELSWGWFQASATHVSAARNRVEVSGEYWLAQWPLFLY